MSSPAPAPNLVSLVRVGTRGVLLPAQVQSRSPPITSHRDRPDGWIGWMDGWMDGGGCVRLRRDSPGNTRPGDLRATGSSGLGEVMGDR